MNKQREKGFTPLEILACTAHKVIRGTRRKLCCSPKRRKLLTGFTILEVLFAIAILVPVCFAVLSINFYMARLADSSRTITTALQDAHTVIERIRDTSRQGLNRVVATFPDGQAVAGVASLPAAMNEQIAVDYANPSADPLAVTVTVTWTDGGRNMRRDLITQVTQR